MSLPIDPLTAAGARPPAGTAPSRATGSGDFAAMLRSAGETATSAAAPVDPVPPASVRAEMAAADRTWQRMAADGRELRFDAHASGGVGVAMHHVSGERIAILQLHDVFALIDGERAG